MIVLLSRAGRAAGASLPSAQCGPTSHHDADRLDSHTAAEVTLDAFTVDADEGQLTVRTRANLHDRCATSMCMWFVCLHLNPL